MVTEISAANILRQVRKYLRDGASTGIVAGLVALGFGIGGAHAQEARPLVNIANGPVRGFARNGVNIFLGIPYAAPPVGDLRWLPPQPVKDWEKPREATRHAESCAQVTTSSFAAPPSINEDCLYLNVYVSPGRVGGVKKPVIVWLHGGGNMAGRAEDYDGGKLATGGPDGVQTVVVTANYRLGLFGIISHSAINSEGHLWGNYTLLDQQEVLRWVQRNIGAFGGDPQRVTLAGQSTAAGDVGANMISPLAKGLFNRAILQSTPAYMDNFPTADIALNRGGRLAEAAGCPGTDEAAAKCLRGLSAARILQLQGNLNLIGPYLTYKPFVDGTILTMPSVEALKSGRFSKMPVLAGGTRDETTFFQGRLQYFSGSQLTEQQYAAALSPGAPCNECVGEKLPAGAAALYPLSAYGGSAMAAYVRVTSDATRCQELRVFGNIASHTSSYAYDFTYRDAPYYFPKMPDFRGLAAHTIDMQFLFEGYHGGILGVNLDQLTGQPRELNGVETGLSNQIIAAWTRFADTGNPNGKGDAPWPKFVPGPSGRYLVQDLSLSTKPVSQFRAEYKCDFWDTPFKMSGNDATAPSGS